MFRSQKGFKNKLQAKREGTNAQCFVYKKVRKISDNLTENESTLSVSFHKTLKNEQQAYRERSNAHCIVYKMVEK